MATERITDQQIVDSVSPDASLLVIQKNESGNEVLFETTLETFIKALKENGIIEECMKTDDYKSDENSLVQEVVVSSEKITVKYLDGKTEEYNTDTFPQVESIENTFGIFLEKVETTEDGESVASGARITFENFIKALKEGELLKDMQKASEFNKLKPNIVKKVTFSKEKIIVEKLDDTVTEISAELYPLVNTLAEDNTLFVTTTEDVEGKTVTSGARITLANLAEALKKLGINSGLMTEEEFAKQKSNIVKKVTLTGNVISVVMLNGSKKDYTIDTTFFDSANVDEEGCLHITKEGKDVIPAILIPALKEKSSAITCKTVGYIFEEVTE